MAAGRTHQTVTVIATPLVALATAYAAGDLALALAAGVGCYLGVWVTPDWDLNKRAPIWRRPYAKFMRHRCRLSHLPVIGTLGRLLYLALLLVPLALLAEWGLLYFGQSAPLVYVDWLHIHLGLAAVAGLMVSDSLHWLWDGMPR
jgi:uncharacterized metal-binding protein